MSDPAQLDDPTLQRLARRAAARPAYLAWVFDQYARRGGPHAAAMAGHLSVSPRDLLRMGLYLRPRADHFQADVTATAAAFRADRFKLADVIRFVDNADVMAGPGEATTPAGSGFLLAARARKGHGKPGGRRDDPDTADPARGRT